MGIVHEQESPDSRVPYPPPMPYSIRPISPTPNQRCRLMCCFSDDEYRACGIELNADLSNQDVLMGVKEVPKEQLLPDKR
ncbi:MAG: hypothetical protein IPL33_06440 [Sphingobacteriales bacterium]|nr:hypothetical protein [Sphingobacteriales bacterium]